MTTHESKHARNDKHAADPAPLQDARDPIPDAPVAESAPGQEATGAREGAGGPFVKAKFDGLVLVCGQCEERGSGPSKLNAKDARKSLKKALGAQRTRVRIVQSSCLGLCPKKALAVAAAGQGAPSLLAAARHERDLQAVAERLGDVARHD